jgi:uncharacterized protein HemX
MNLILSNFLRRVADAVRRNRRALIKVVIAVVASLIIAWLVIYAIERFQQWGYEKGVKALELKFNEAEAKAKASEARAVALESLIKANEAEYADLKRRADAADARLGETTIVYRTVKERYETVRDNPDVPACVSYADACKELSRLGFECR